MPGRELLSCVHRDGHETPQAVQEVGTAAPPRLQAQRWGTLPFFLSHRQIWLKRHCFSFLPVF